MTRMGSSTRVAADYRKKKHTKRCNRLRNLVNEGHSRAMMTPKNKGGDMVYLTAELGTEGGEEFDALIKTN